MDQDPGRRPTSGDPWRPTEADLALVAVKPKRARLEFATLLLSFRAHGRFPRTSAESAPEQLARGRPAARPRPANARLAAPPRPVPSSATAPRSPRLRHAAGRRPRRRRPGRLAARSRRRRHARHRRSRRPARGPVPRARPGTALGRPGAAPRTLGGCRPMTSASAPASTAGCPRPPGPGWTGSCAPRPAMTGRSKAEGGGRADRPAPRRPRRPSLASVRDQLAKLEAPARPRFARGPLRRGAAA